MTAARLVSLAFLVAASSLLLLAACGAGGPPAGSAEALYVDMGCAKCHGPDRLGQRSGPPLIELAERWDEDGLVAYLQDPRSFVETNPRLSYLDEQYPIAMPSYGTTPDEDLRRLAQLMLGG